jgi:hypothetical protein
MTTKTIPAAALQFRAEARFLFVDQADGPTPIEPGKAVAVEITARTDQPAEHWYFGRIVHDLQGMRVDKQIIPLDYLHDPRDIIGFADKITAGDGAVTARGNLVPVRADDRAAEILTRGRAGVPYQASIDFNGEGVKLEQLAEGVSAKVNGYTFEGPGVIVRQWPLRAIALCPHGVDSNTSAQFAAAQPHDTTVTFTDNQEATEMPTEDPNAVTPPEDQATPPVAEPAPDEAPAEEAEPAAEPALSAALADVRDEFRRFCDAFGEKAATYFAAGLTFEQAALKFAADMAAENADLKTRLAAVNRGEATPLSSGHAAEPPAGKKSPAGDPAQFHKLGDNVAKVAAGMVFSTQPAPKN